MDVGAGLQPRDSAALKGRTYVRADSFTLFETCVSSRSATVNVSPSSP